MKQVAETGATGIILGELARARSNGFAGSVMVGGGPSPGGKTSVRLVADCKHSRISMISMLAPSPDWFVGLSNVKLVQNGRFIGGESGKLKVMDAGTDSGTMLMSRDKKTIGPENIAPLNSAPFYQKSVADYEIRKIGK